LLELLNSIEEEGDKNERRHSVQLQVLLGSLQLCVF